MTNNFDEAGIRQYLEIFGRGKMQNLWVDFVDDAKEKLSNIENKNTQEQRLVYHSLRSSSLVFGMKKFSELCHQYEEKILSGAELLEEDFEKIKKLLAETIIEVKAYLK